jgi:peptide deformylase
MAILKVARLGHPVLRTKAQPVLVPEIGSPRIQQLIDDMLETMREYQGIGLAAPQVHVSLRIFVAGLRGSPSVSETRGASGAAVMPVASSAVVTPAVSGARATRGTSSAAVMPGAPSAAVMPGASGAVVMPGASGAVVMPGASGAVVMPGASGAVVMNDDHEMPLVVLVNPELSLVPGASEEAWEGCLSVPDMRGRVPRAIGVHARGYDRRGKRIEIVAKGLPARVIQHEYDHLDGILFFDRMPTLATLTFMDEYQRFWAKSEHDEEDDE